MKMILTIVFCCLNEMHISIVVKKSYINVNYLYNYGNTTFYKSLKINPFNFWHGICVLITKV